MKKKSGKPIKPEIRVENNKEKPSLEIAPQINYIIKDNSLIRTIVFAQCIMAIICFLSYFAYCLFYDYLTIVIFSVISSIALRKSKDQLVTKIFDLIYCLDSTTYKSSVVYRSFSWIKYNVLHFKENRKILIPRIIDNIKSFNITNDIYVISFVFIAYLLFFNLQLNITLLLFVVAFLLEFISRCLIDVFFYFKYRMGFYLSEIPNQKKSKLFEFFFSDKNKTKETINQCVTIFMIFVFFFMMIAVFIIFLAFCAKDAKHLLLKSNSLYELLLKKINGYFGLDLTEFPLENFINKHFEKFLIDFLNKEEVSAAFEFSKSYFRFFFMKKNLNCFRIFF